MDILLTLIAMLILLLLQGFFSGSEIALVNADKLKLKHRARQGHNGCKMVLKQFEKPERLLATTLIGTNIATVLLATLGTVMTIRYFGEGGDVLAFLLIMPVMLIFGEVVPKSVYQQKSDEIAPIVIYPLYVFSWIFFPVILIFSSFAKVMVRIFSRNIISGTVFVAREKIRTLLDSVEQAPSTDIFDHQRIKNAIKYSDVTAGDVMTPLSDAVTFNSEHSFSQAIDLVIKSGYNRLPVYDTDASRITGVLVITTWDLLDPDIRQRAMNDFILPAKFVPPSQSAEKLLTALHARVDHMAIVVDEFGSAVGLLTAEDIMEEVVGEIDDVDYRLYHHHHILPRKLDVDTYLVDAHISIAQLNEFLNTDFQTKEFYTVGGLMVNRLNRIPEVDDFIVESGFRFIAVDCDERMVKTVKVIPELRH